MVKVTDGQRFHPTSSRFGVANHIICPMIVVIDSYCMFLFSNVLTFKQVIQKVLAVLGSSWQFLVSLALQFVATLLTENHSGTVGTNAQLSC